MLVKTARGFARAVETWNGLPPQIDDLRLRTDAQAGKAIVNARSGPRGVKRRRLNFVHGHRLSEILVFSFVDERIVTCDRGFKRRGCHGFLLIFADNFRGEFAQRLGAEKPSVGVDKRRGNSPVFTFHGVRIEDGPDRPASLTFPGALFQARIPPVKSRRELIDESLAHLIHLNEILIVRDLQADAAGDSLDGTISYIFIPFSAALRVSVLIADDVRFFKNVRARLGLHRLATRAPKRSTNLHGGNFAVARLP